MHQYNPSKNDMFFLFKTLPINVEQVNFTFCNNVKIVGTPKNVIENPLGNEKPQRPHEDINLTCFINPFHYLGAGFKHICLIAPNSCKDQAQSIWRVLCILRLIKPLHIFVMSQFVFDEKIIKHGQHMQDSRLNKNSFINKAEVELYQLEDLEYVNKLLPIIDTILRPQTKYPQLRQAILHFFQATLKEKWHYVSTGFQKLFPGIDCLFGNLKGPKIPSSINSWLQDYVTQDKTKINYLKPLFEYLWDTYRHVAAHGHPPLTIGAEINIDQEAKACFCVHELLRYSLLKMLDLDDKTLSKYEEICADKKNKTKNLSVFFQGTLNNQFSKEKKEAKNKKLLIDQFLKDTS